MPNIGLAQIAGNLVECFFLNTKENGTISKISSVFNFCWVVNLKSQKIPPTK